MQLGVVRAIDPLILAVTQNGCIGGAEDKAPCWLTICVTKPSQRVWSPQTADEFKDAESSIIT